jgi:single-stranded-DNA-specific exonuclease
MIIMAIVDHFAGEEAPRMKYEKWNIGTPDAQQVESLRSAGYSYLLATVLSARGVGTPEAAAENLQRERKLSSSPMLMRDMDRAVERIQRAVARGETIAVFGDYDVDGITSTVVVLDYLKRCGAKCLRYIPRRIEDGYGLSREALRALRDQGASLVVTVDCGVTGNDEVDYANSIGLDVVITDHHECKGDLPAAAAVVDPHRADCPYPFKHLAGVGVALKLVMALGGENREDSLFARYCTLAAIGTVADVMLMDGENRTIVRCGLESLAHTDFVGVHALLKEAGLLGKPITSIQIGFVLSPRINAAGRMGAADLAADLLETDDPLRAETLARQLCDLNRERQSVEQDICADAVAQIEKLPDEERSALVLASEDWHQGVVGIVASRLSEKYSCPSFMIHLQDGMGKGSCRSYGGFNLFAALESCADLLDGYGGHELAAGFTIRRENIAAFRTRMNRCVRAANGGGLPVSSLEVDASVACPGEISLREVEDLDMLEPFGAGNPRPVFALLGATVDAVQSVGQGRHLKLRLSKGAERFRRHLLLRHSGGIRPSTARHAGGRWPSICRSTTFRGVHLRCSCSWWTCGPRRCPSARETEAISLCRRCAGEGSDISPRRSHPPAALPGAVRRVSARAASRISSIPWRSPSDRGRDRPGHRVHRRALLHDCIEDTDATHEEISKLFGETVAAWWRASPS